jgi:hypothetical protein
MKILNLEFPNRSPLIKIFHGNSNQIRPQFSCFFLFTLFFRSISFYRGKGIKEIELIALQGAPLVNHPLAPPPPKGGVMEASRPLFYCILQEGHVDQEHMIPGTYLGQYGVFFWVTGTNLLTREGRAQANEQAQKFKQKIERRHKCLLYPPEVRSMKSPKTIPCKIPNRVFMNYFSKLYSSA